MADGGRAGLPVMPWPDEVTFMGIAWPTWPDIGDEILRGVELRTTGDA